MSLIGEMYNKLDEKKKKAYTDGYAKEKEIYEK